MPLQKPPRGREADGPRNPIRKNGRTNQEGEGGGRALADMTPLLSSECQIKKKSALSLRATRV
ncbi:hypothetical protein NTPn50_09370 [Streptococcus pneumoniae]|nr:hypothetical protein NTPn50_09370 [Streptococcus pneumoniae]PLV80915.1 hypothetical protein AZJ80_06860 [Streptococcus pneumoniae]PLV90519.1 hypothetical protein AZJ18_06520 [Streptococcus pneumoniae]PLV98065.1 hypothetical protein AZJ17_05130 [Streptococcus pneumoniae]